MRINKHARRVETSSAVAISGIVVAAVLAMSACADMDPSTRRAAVGSGIALVAGGALAR